MIFSNSEKNKIIKLSKKYNDFVELSKLSGNSILELVMLGLDYKPAVADTITYTKELKMNIPKIKELSQKLGLFFAISKYKYIVNSPRGIFEEISLDDPREGKIIFSYSKTKDKAEKGAVYYHEKMLNSEYGYKFGKLMGYPECCLQFGNYLNNNNQDPNNFGFKNPAVESLKRSYHFDWRLNIFTNSPLPYYPCSLTCAKSIEYVERLLFAFSILDSNISDFLKKILSEPVSLYWTCADKIFLYGDFKQPILGQGEIKYERIEVWLNSKTFYQAVDKNQIKKWNLIAEYLKKGNRLVVNDKFIKIYFNREKIFEVAKENKYIPILIKPDILP
ncbi:MAG: hypothetical protein ACP5IC_02415 [Minisyncoccia bacterium]